MAEKIAEKEKEIVEITKRETECRTKLSGLRRTAAKLIRALNEVCEVILLYSFTVN